MSIVALSLSVGAEVDYCIVDDAWVLARVEGCDATNGVRVRFAVGSVEVVRVIESNAAAASCLAPAGTFSLPLLKGQKIDVLVRAVSSRNNSATGVAPVMDQQWQRGE